MKQEERNTLIWPDKFRKKKIPSYKPLALFGDLLDLLITIFISALALLSMVKLRAIYVKWKEFIEINNIINGQCYITRSCINICKIMEKQTMSLLFRQELDLISNLNCTIDKISVISILFFRHGIVSIFILYLHASHIRDCLTPPPFTSSPTPPPLSLL